MTKLATKRQEFEEASPYEDQVVKIYRCSTVVKGGRRFSFAGLVVVGNRAGEVGFGYGKANEVPPAVEKAIKEARKSIVKVNLLGSTIPHEVAGRFGATKVVLVPADEGTGVIAGASARAGAVNSISSHFGNVSAQRLDIRALTRRVRPWGN